MIDIYLANTLHNSTSAFIFFCLSSVPQVMTWMAELKDSIVIDHIDHNPKMIHGKNLFESIYYNCAVKLLCFKKMFNQMTELVFSTTIES